MKKLFASIRTLIHPRFTLCVLIFIILITVGYIAYIESQSYISRDLDSSFQNLVSISDINSSLRVKVISINRDEPHYWDPEVTIKVENHSDKRVILSTVRAFIVGDEKWIEIFNNSNVHLLNNGEMLTLYSKGTSQQNCLQIKAWPILGYPTGYYTEGMKVKKLIRLLVRGELLSDVERLPIGAYADVLLSE